MKITYAKQAVKAIGGMDRKTKQRMKIAIESLPQGQTAEGGLRQLSAAGGRLARPVFLSYRRRNPDRKNPAARPSI